MATESPQTFGWLAVYYRQASSFEDFAAASPIEQWARLREVVMNDNPKNDVDRAAAIDGVREDERVRVLAWLEAKSK